MRRLFFSIMLLVSVVFAARDAVAQDADPLSAAEAAYDAATQAHAAGDFARAARLFATADELAPNPVALETALQEALRAELPALAMELVRRSARETSVSPSLAEAVALARDRYVSRVGFLEVRCGGCAVTLDDAPVAPGRALVVETGARRVKIDAGGRVEQKIVEVAAGQTVVVEPTPDPTPPRPARPATRAPDEPRRELEGIHPAWITMGLVGTAGFGGATIALYVDALSIEDELETKRRNHDTQGADELIARGKDAELRTYVVGGLCAGSALATAAVAVFAIDWNGADPGRLAAGSRPVGRSPKLRMSMGPTPGIELFWLLE
jgi:hypothetical protein